MIKTNKKYPSINFVSTRSIQMGYSFLYTNKTNPYTQQILRASATVLPENKKIQEKPDGNGHENKASVFNFTEAAPTFTNAIESNAFIKTLWDYTRLQEAELHLAQEKLNKNSTNSSIPSSQESLADKANRAKKELNGKQTRGRQQGAQKGHVGHGRKLLPTNKCDIIIACNVPSHCTCGCATESSEVTRRKQVFDISEHHLTVTEYQLYQSKCQCGKVYKGKLPDDVPMGILSANSIAIISSITGKFKLSKRNACELLYDFFGLKISVGTVSNAEHIVANALKPAHQEAQGHIQTAPVRNSDETGFYYHHHLTWMWCAATPTVSFYQIEHSRSQESAKVVLGEGHEGITIVDRCPSYGYIPDRNKQYCWSHLGRDITAIVEKFDPIQSRIGDLLQQTQYAIFNDYNALIEAPHHGDIKASLFANITIFHRTLRKGRTLEKCQTRSFCQNLLKHFTCLWRFIHYPDVEPTNNHGEREIRPAVIYRKQSFGVQSLRGERYTERVLTVSRTCKKQQQSFITFVSDSVKALWVQGAFPLLIQPS